MLKIDTKVQYTTYDLQSQKLYSELTHLKLFFCRYQAHELCTRRAPLQYSDGLKVFKDGHTRQHAKSWVV